MEYESKTEIFRGTIKGFQGSWLSGLATLLIEDESGNLHHVNCDNGATVRALESCFGDTIASGHTVNPEGGYIGQEIFYSYDDMGMVLEGFTPVSEASVELVELYEKTRMA